MIKMFYIAGLQVYSHFVVKTTMEDLALIMGFFDRSNTKVRGVAANLGKKDGKLRYSRICTVSEAGWTGMFRPETMGRDRFLYCVATNKEIDNRFLLTTQEKLFEDFFHYLMNHYKMPLLRWWIPFLLTELLDIGYVAKTSLTMDCCSDMPIEISLHGCDINIRDLICYDFAQLTEEGLQNVVSKLLRTRTIFISKSKMKPLEFKNFNEYIENYGPTLVDNLNKQIAPLVPLMPNVKTVALKKRSLFPQQAACVNGILAMRKKGISYAVLNEGMGVGKTLQTYTAIEGATIEDYLRKNPGKTLRDAYQPGVINYRVCVMPPGHLVEKWKEAVEEDVPYAKGIIVDSLAQFIELREQGKKPDGKEFYIFSKDFAKLDTLQSPTPTQLKWKPFSLDICKDCLDDEQKIVYKKGYGQNAICPACKGHHFVPDIISTSNFYGLICPACGELLIKNKGYDTNKEEFFDNLKSFVLTPKDFSSKKNENSCCYHCGTALWGSNAKPIKQFNMNVERVPKWYKVSHYSNHAKRGKTTAFVMKGHENEYACSVTTSEGWEESSNVYGPRKVAPAKYIKKYLKGFFDFCVLDECHKYLGESAQSVAAHALIKASKFSLLLTGTISNGTAEAFFNLFWMVEPCKLLNLGYTHSSSDLMRFCKEYGCVETVYEISPDNNRNHNVMSRGKQLSSPKVKPGISPVLLGKLLMDRCLFLDISDLSKYLPKFSEKVELVPVPDDLQADYVNVIEILQEQSHNGSGMAVLSTMLQFGLSYLDKPYGKEPIMDPFKKDMLIVKPANHEEYADIGYLTPKEERLVELVKKELEEGRNCFIYASFTASPETNVTYRLKELIETYCNLRGRVAIIQSNTPPAKKREEWFHKRASEGIKVFITNPMNIETGLDFCFDYNGIRYNYPTLIFYQTGYSLATIWQASRRAYRLNQTAECRNYYLAYEDTLQAAALEIMAKKQAATAAIQGHFSTEGLAAMAKGVDTRAQLAAALSKNDMSSRESLENMFDALSNATSADDSYQDFVPSPSFYEVMGYVKSTNSVQEMEDVFNFFKEQCDDELPFELDEPVVKTKDSSFDVFDSLDSFFDSIFACNATENISEPLTIVSATSKKKAVKKTVEGELSLFDLIAV